MTQDMQGLVKVANVLAQALAAAVGGHETTGETVEGVVSIEAIGLGTNGSYKKMRTILLMDGNFLVEALDPTGVSKTVIIKENFTEEELDQAIKSIA